MTKGGCTMFNNGQAVEECDATGFNSSSAAWFTNKYPY